MAALWKKKKLLQMLAMKSCWTDVSFTLGYFVYIWISHQHKCKGKALLSHSNFQQFPTPLPSPKCHFWTHNTRNLHMCILIVFLPGFGHYKRSAVSKNVWTVTIFWIPDEILVPKETWSKLLTTYLILVCNSNHPGYYREIHWFLMHLTFTLILMN